jgi:hypothetical protein
MPYIQNHDALPVVTTTPCIHLRNKAMYVRGVVGDADQFPDESGAGQCWCNLTQHCLGPDSTYANRQQCIPSRECYKETY